MILRIFMYLAFAFGVWSLICTAYGVCRFIKYCKRHGWEDWHDYFKGGIFGLDYEYDFRVPLFITIICWIVALTIATAR